MVVNPKISIAALHNGIGSDPLHFLSQDADVGAVGSVVGKSIKAEAVVEVAKKNDVVLQRHIRPPSTTTPAATAEPTSAAAKAGRSESAPASAHARTKSVPLGVPHWRTSSRMSPVRCCSPPAGVPCSARRF